MLNIFKNGPVGSRSIKLLRLSIIKRFILTSQTVYTSINKSEKEYRIGRPYWSTALINQQKIKNTRTLSTLENHSVPIASRLAVSKDEFQNFMAVFPDIVRDLTEAAKNYNTSYASDWFARALEYNVPKGKKNRGLLTVLTYKNLVNSKDITEESLKLAHILGWCVEMLQCFFIINDDVMDCSTTRRGQPCWHKLDDVGLIAVNDALMIENAIYILLKKYFSNLSCYVDLLELFHEITFITTCGQTLDVLNATKSVTTFDMDKYNAVVTNKTAYYSFYLPFALAMHLAGIKDQEVFRQSKDILLEMGHFFQVQDDFLDCFGDPNITGKIGTDIQDNKCSWLAVVCMQKANEEQKKIMLDCYGKKDPEKVVRVIELYKELDLPNAYAIYERKSYNLIKTHIEQISHAVPHQIFQQILNKIYQRDS